MKKILLASALALAVLSCEKVKDKAAGAVNSGAQAVGRTASDVVNNIDKGISESAAINIELSEDLKNGGLTFGKYYFRNGAEGNENVLSLYLITDKDINRELYVKLYDKKGVEMGRTKLRLNQKKGDAAYHDLVFDPKIDFEYQSKLTIE